MNKWQIICPVVLLLGALLWAGHAHFQSQETVMLSAIERHLGVVLGELEAHQDAGRFPAPAVASALLNDADIQKRVYVTSLFGAKDLRYTITASGGQRCRNPVCSHS